MDKPGNFLSGLFIKLSGFFGQCIDPTVDVAVRIPVKIEQRIEHALGFLSC